MENAILVSFAESGKTFILNISILKQFSEEEKI
jgi:hypothetical protein